MEMFSMEITTEIAEIADEFSASKYPSKFARDAALLQEIARLRCELSLAKQAAEYSALQTCEVTKDLAESSVVNGTNRITDGLIGQP